MLIRQDIVIGLLPEEIFPAGIYKLRLRISLVPGQHEDVHGDARSIEEIGRQRNDRFHKVAVHKIFPYLLFRAATVQDFSAVTGACLLVKASVWDEVGGLDEKFAVAFNDVDFCLRVRDAGYRVAWTPYAQLTHYESKSRGGDEKDPVKAARFAAEQQRLYDIHGKADILDDPYYNPSLTRDREDFSESGDLRNLKEGKVTARWRNA